MPRIIFIISILILGFFSTAHAENYTWPLSVDASGTSAVIKGKLDTSKYTADQLKTVSLELYIAKTAFAENTDPSAKTDLFGRYVSQPGKSLDSGVGIALDGTYYFVGIKNLTPNQTYYYAQKLTIDGKSEVKMDNFDSSKGNLTPEEQEQRVEDHSYRLLAPWPGLSVFFDPKICMEKLAAGGDPAKLHCSTDDPTGLNTMLNFIFKVIIGLAALALVLRLMFEGYKYVVTDVPFLKTSAKSGIMTSALGLLLALSSYIILNTINPRLVSNTIGLEKVTIDVVNFPDAGDDTIDPDFSSGKALYSKDASLSPEVATVVDKIKNGGWEIDHFKVYPNDRMAIFIKKGAEMDSSNVISVSHGKGGFAPTGQARQGDKKTPMGIWKIIDIRKPAAPGRPIFNANGSNMGAAFFHLSPMINGERGIGMHGNKNGTLTPTIGCIRLKNADIEALLPYVKVGTTVIVGN